VVEQLVETISEFTCPLCGHLHSIRTYDPEDLPLDILAVLKVGLGHGLGTKVVDRYSILGDDDVTPKVVKRVMKLCRLFLDEKLVTQSAVKSSLGLVDVPQPETVSLRDYNRLREDLEALRVQDESHRMEAERESVRADNLLARVESLNGKVSSLESQLSSSKLERSRLAKEVEEEARMENLDSSLDDWVQEFEDRTDFLFNPAEESREAFLGEAISKLLEDLEALKADDVT
jgi:hypothetical protein